MAGILDLLHDSFVQKSQIHGGLHICQYGLISLMGKGTHIGIGIHALGQGRRVKPDLEGKQHCCARRDRQKQGGQDQLSGSPKKWRTFHLGLLSKWVVSASVTRVICSAMRIRSSLLML